MTDGPLRALLLEDSEADAELIAECLNGSGSNVNVRRVDSRSAFLAGLTEFHPHVVLSDHGFATFTALDALDLLKETDPTMPFIVVTGATDERWGMACLRAGADDIVSKNVLAELRPAIDRALALRAELSTLSPRQLEVLRLIVRGGTTGQIAKQLGVSGKTIETHRTALMRRLDIHDVSGLVRYAVKVRLLPPDGN